MNKTFKLNLGLLAAMVLGGLVLYHTPLGSKGFYFDDHFSIESNEAIKTLDIPRIFNAFNTRFLVGLSFALNYKWCGLNPEGYRFVNLLIHCLNAFLVYLLIKSTGPKVGHSGCSIPVSYAALFGSLLFLCHPLQTEPVNFITQRFVLMGSFFYLVTLYSYIQYRLRAKKTYLVISLISAMAAMFCKEFVVTLPVMMAVYEFYFFNSLKETPGQRIRLLLPFFVMVLLVPILLSKTPREAVLVANIAGSDSIQDVDRRTSSTPIDLTRAHGGMGRKSYFLTELHVICTYIRLLFFPVNQNFDYDYPITNVMGPKTALCGLLLCGLLVVSVLTYQLNRMISFSIVWFFIALSLESSIIPIGHVIAEYRVYLASVSFAFLLSSLIYAREGNVKILNSLAAIILVIFSICTYQRNKVWRDELSLWNDTVSKSPHKSRPYYSRALAYYNLGELPQAIADYNKAIELNPFYAEGYDNRGVAYYKEGQLALALADYNRALEIDPHLLKVYINRGNLYESQGHLTEAFLNYSKAITLNCDYAQAYNNRGNIYVDQGKLPEAFADYSKAIDINPSFAEAYNNRGTLNGQQGNLAKAIEDFSKAIESNPRLAGAYYNRAFAYYFNKEYHKAWDDVRAAKVLGYVVNPNFINMLSQASGENRS